MKKFLSLALVLVLALSFASFAGAEAEKRTVEFWHCSGGTIGEAVQANVDAFNASQDEIFVNATFQGSYDDSLIKIKAAVPAGKAPTSSTSSRWLPLTWPPRIGLFLSPICSRRIPS